MPSTDFPFGYNLPAGPSKEVLAMQKIQNGVTNATLDILKITWYVKKEEPECPAPPQ